MNASTTNGYITGNRYFGFVLPVYDDGGGKILSPTSPLGINVPTDCRASSLVLVPYNYVLPDNVTRSFWPVSTEGRSYVCNADHLKNTPDPFNLSPLLTAPSFESSVTSCEGGSYTLLNRDGSVYKNCT